MNYVAYKNIYFSVGQQVKYVGLLSEIVSQDTTAVLNVFCKRFPHINYL